MDELKALKKHKQWVMNEKSQIMLQERIIHLLLTMILAWVLTFVTSTHMDYMLGTTPFALFFYTLPTAFAAMIMWQAGYEISMRYLKMPRLAALAIGLIMGAAFLSLSVLSSLAFTVYVHPSFLVLTAILFYASPFYQPTHDYLKQ